MTGVYTNVRVIEKSAEKFTFSNSSPSPEGNEHLANSMSSSKIRITYASHGAERDVEDFICEENDSPTSAADQNDELNPANRQAVDEGTLLELEESKDEIGKDTEEVGESIPNAEETAKHMADGTFDDNQESTAHRGDEIPSPLSLTKQVSFESIEVQQLEDEAIKDSHSRGALCYETSGELNYDIDKSDHSIISPVPSRRSLNPSHNYDIDKSDHAVVPRVSSRRSLSDMSEINSRPRKRNNRKSAQVFDQAVWFLGSFLLTHFFSTLSRSVEHATGETFFLITAFQAFFDPLQGFTNFVIYRRPKYMAHRRRNPDASRFASVCHAIQFSKSSQITAAY